MVNLIFWILFGAFIWGMVTAVDAVLPQADLRRCWCGRRDEHMHVEPGRTLTEAEKDEVVRRLYNQ